LFPEPPLGGPGDLGQVIQFGDHPKKRGLRTNCRPLNFFSEIFAPEGAFWRARVWNAVEREISANLRQQFEVVPPVNFEVATSAVITRQELQMSASSWVPTFANREIGVPERAFDVAE
jgi:hypothetical protein